MLFTWICHLDLSILKLIASCDGCHAWSRRRLLNLEHLVVLLAGPISHTSTRCMDLVEIFNIILDLSITCFSHFSGCWASFMFIVITLSWNAITCFLESSWVWDRFLLLLLQYDVKRTRLGLPTTPFLFKTKENNRSLLIRKGFKQYTFCPKHLIMGIKQWHYNRELPTCKIVTLPL